jgi:hypothetical protein
LAIDAKQQEAARKENMRQNERKLMLADKYGRKWLNWYLRKKKNAQKPHQYRHAPDTSVRPLNFSKRSPIKTPPRTRILEDATFRETINKGEKDLSYRATEKRIYDWFQKDFRQRDKLAPRTGVKERTPEKGGKKVYDHIFLEDFSLMNSPIENNRNALSQEKRKELEIKTRDFEIKLQRYKSLMTHDKEKEAGVKAEMVSLKLELKKMLREINLIKGV